MHFTCRSFSGNSESKSWSRYWENDPDDPILKSIKGHLFALVNINSPEDKDLNSIGHDINYEFNQNYFSPDNKLNILDNLRQSIDSIVKNPLYSGYEISFSAAVILNNQLFLITYGNCHIIFKRQDQISILINGTDNQVDTLVGSVENKDRIFLSTKSFFENITWAKIKNFLSDPKIQNVEENFLSSIFSLTNQKDLAAALIEIESDQEDIPVIEDKPQSVILEPIITSSKLNFSISKIFQFFKKKSSKKSVFVSHHEINEVGKRKKINLFIIFFLIICFVLSIFFGYQKNKNQKLENQYQSLKTEIEIQIDNINKTKSLSLDGAREAAVAAQKTLEKMSALNINLEEVKNYDSQLKDILSQTGSSETFNPDFVYDTNTIFNNPNFQKILFNNSNLYFFDPDNGRIDSLDIKNKSTKNIVNSDKIKDAFNFDLDNNNFYILTKEDIFLVDRNNTLSSKIDLSDISAIDFKFWNSAAYVLDADSQTVWKFNPNATGFSKAQNWLKNNAKLTSTPISLSINGKIWVLTQNGLVTPYLTGVKDVFKASQESEFTKANHLDVTLEKELLTFVDNDNIIYLYQKTGELLSKYNLGELQVNDLAFDEINNSIYILCSDQKIYSIKF